MFRPMGVPWTANSNGDGPPAPVGKGQARAIASGAVDRDVVEAAARYMQDEDSGLGFVYSAGPNAPCTIAGSKGRRAVDGGFG
jgi:hypothetical protein